MDWNGLEWGVLVEFGGCCGVVVGLGIGLGVGLGFKGRNWGFLLSYGFSKVNKLHFYSRL